ncbi:hypothetical protein QKS34_gp4 [Frankliniella occidentalis associated mesonivirus 1]|uniref:Uncharacterized protein n=1 Tax=Frankliniella occidentalis associated mesonivirus 1 TaxID=2767230 RepID=A0AAE7JCD2_9NIDO|nr:hypothetical protein QKS34_gp4 [Frankliniella occidentalis associated mesonivirus 1]QNM37797.1 hypothetical protein [Frankliniella occidentalis associated mesonivirus 1]
MVPYVASDKRRTRTITSNSAEWLKQAVHSPIIRSPRLKLYVWMTAMSTIRERLQMELSTPPPSQSPYNAPSSRTTSSTEIPLYQMTVPIESTPTSRNSSACINRASSTCSITLVLLLTSAIVLLCRTMPGAVALSTTLQSSIDTSNLVLAHPGDFVTVFDKLYLHSYSTDIEKHKTLLKHDIFLYRHYIQQIRMLYRTDTINTAVGELLYSTNNLLNILNITVLESHYPLYQCTKISFGTPSYTVNFNYNEAKTLYTTQDILYDYCLNAPRYANGTIREAMCLEDFSLAKCVRPAFDLSFKRNKRSVIYSSEGHLTVTHRKLSKTEIGAKPFIGTKTSFPWGEFHGLTYCDEQLSYYDDILNYTFNVKTPSPKNCHNHTRDMELLGYEEINDELSQYDCRYLDHGSHWSHHYRDYPIAFHAMPTFNYYLYACRRGKHNVYNEDLCRRGQCQLKFAFRNNLNVKCYFFKDFTPEQCNHHWNKTAAQLAEFLGVPLISAYHDEEVRVHPPLDISQEKHVRAKRWAANAVCGWPVVSLLAKTVGGECEYTSDQTQLKNLLTRMNDLNGVVVADDRLLTDTVNNINSRMSSLNKKYEDLFRKSLGMQANYQKLLIDYAKNTQNELSDVVNQNRLYMHMSNQFQLLQLQLIDYLQDVSNHHTHLYAYFVMSQTGVTDGVTTPDGIKTSRLIVSNYREVGDDIKFDMYVPNEINKGMIYTFSPLTMRTDDGKCITGVEKKVVCMNDIHNCYELPNPACSMLNGHWYCQVEALSTLAKYKPILLETACFGLRNVYVHPNYYYSAYNHTITKRDGLDTTHIDCQAGVLYELECGSTYQIEPTYLTRREIHLDLSCDKSQELWVTTPEDATSKGRQRRGITSIREPVEQLNTDVHTIQYNTLKMLNSLDTSFLHSIARTLKLEDDGSNVVTIVNGLLNNFRNDIPTFRIQYGNFIANNPDKAHEFQLLESHNPFLKLLLRGDATPGLRSLRSHIASFDLHKSPTFNQTITELTSQLVAVNQSIQEQLNALDAQDGTDTTFSKLINQQLDTTRRDLEHARLMQVGMYKDINKMPSQLTSQTGFYLAIVSMIISTLSFLASLYLCNKMFGKYAMLPTAASLVAGASALATGDVYNTTTSLVNCTDITKALYCHLANFASCFVLKDGNNDVDACYCKYNKKVVLYQELPTHLDYCQAPPLHHTVADFFASTFGGLEVYWWLFILTIFLYASTILGILIYFRKAGGKPVLPSFKRK